MNEKAIEKIKPFLRHHPSCNVLQLIPKISTGNMVKCDCGLTKALALLEKQSEPSEATKEGSNLIPMPEKLIGKFFNSCTEPCDFLIGPCACGAWHDINDLVQRLNSLGSAYDHLTEENKELKQADKDHLSARRGLEKRLQTLTEERDSYKTAIEIEIYDAESHIALADGCERRNLQTLVGRLKSYLTTPRKEQKNDTHTDS